MDGLVIVTDPEGIVISASGAPAGPLCLDADDVIGRSILDVISLEVTVDELGSEPTHETDVELVRPDGSSTPVLFSASGLTSSDNDTLAIVCLATDLSERKRMEAERQHAQRLESVGQLAAGVAHEINTPVQFIGDSMHFLSDCVDDLLGLLDGYRALPIDETNDTKLSAAAMTLRKAEDDIGLDFIRAEAPQAVERTVDGVARVAAIVKAMKQFSHPGRPELAPENLNDIVTTALTMAQGEVKHVAEVVTDLGDADAFCSRGEMSQVVLNLVVNAAHAVAEIVDGTTRRGTITIATWTEGDWVRLTVTDDGGGVPAEIQDRIFDPFFTTKEVGRGTGQGLAITRRIVVDHHGGRLTLDVDRGVGSTFGVWLPRQGDAS